MVKHVKLIPGALPLYCVSSTTLNTIKIEGDGIEITISIDWASLTPSQTQLQNDIADDQHNRSLLHSSVRDGGKFNEQLGQSKDKENQPQDYNVNHIIGHVDMSAKGGLCCDGLDTRHVTTNTGTARAPHKATSFGLNLILFISTNQ